MNTCLKSILVLLLYSLSHSMENACHVVAYVALVSGSDTRRFTNAVFSLNLAQFWASNKGFDAERQLWCVVMQLQVEASG